VRHRLGLATRTQISVCKSPFPSAGTAVSLVPENFESPRLPRLPSYHKQHSLFNDSRLCIATGIYTESSSSSRMRVIYHNWSATKQRPHPQSVAEISHHSVLSGDRIRQCETSSGSRHKDTDQCL